METQKSAIESLPSFCRSTIISFLPTFYVFKTIPLVCRNFHQITMESRVLTVELFKNLIGPSPLLKEFLSSKNAQDIRNLVCDILKSTFNPKQLPIYGFQTDGGIDECRESFSFHRLFSTFERHEYFNTYSSEVANLIHVQGTLAIDYYEHCVDPQQVDKAFATEEEKSEFFEDKFHLKTKNSDIKGPRDTLNKLIVEGKATQSEIEYSYIPLENCYGILSEIRVILPKSYTCPVQTLMVFVSDERIDLKDPCLKVFDNAKTYADVLSLYTNDSLKNDLPQIISNDDQHNKKDEEGKDNENEKSSCSKNKILFVNRPNGLSYNVKPVIWLHVPNATTRDFEVELDKENLFGGKYFTVKMLDINHGVYDNAPNMDIKCVVLSGCLIGGDQKIDLLRKYCP